MKKIILLLQILICCSLFSQENDFEIDLNNILKISDSNKRIDSLEKFAKYVTFKDAEIGAKAGYKLQELTKNTKKQTAYLTSYNVLGLSMLYLQKTNLAISYLDTLVTKAKSWKDTLMQAKAHGNLGLVYERKGDFKKAFEQYSNALKCAELLNNKSVIASSYGNLGNVSIRLKQNQAAIPYLKKAAIIFDSIGNKKALANQYNSLAQVYGDINDKVKEKSYLLSAEKILREIEDKKALGTVLINLATVENNQKNYSSSIKIGEEALKLKLETNEMDGAATAMVNLASSYAEIGKYDKANVLLEEARKITVESNDLFLQSEILKKQAYILKLSGNYRDAYNLLLDYIDVKDTLLGKETQLAVAEFKEKYESDKKEQENKLLNIQNELSKETIKQQRTFSYFIITALVLSIGLAFFIFKGLKQQKKANQIISKQKQVVESKNHIIEEKQKEILDSIHYAKRIQNTLLAHQDFLNENLPENFVLYKPKDIVSGDFYWATKHNDKFYLAICDSTGHGVPGAFMSLLNIGFLSEAINEKNILEPHKVFDYVRKRLLASVSKEEQKDGFDGILLCFNESTKEVTYAAAHNAPVLISNNELVELPKDKMPVGAGEKDESFKLNTIKAHKGDVLYLYTDGYADQFGGEKGKKFRYKQLNELLLANTQAPLIMQKEILDAHFENWRGNLEQVDDVCIIGLKFH